MIKIVADTTCNLPEETIRKFDIRLAPISIQFGDESFEEGIDIDRDTFYAKIEELGMIPTTSQPTPAWFAEHFRELHAQGHAILVITLTRKHSGTFDSAILAKSMVPEAEIEVFDSASISLGTGWMILEAARAIERGLNMAAVLERLKAIRERAKLFLTPATLKYLQMSGRVGRLQGAIASLLNVKPIIALEDGTLEAGKNVRTRSKALNRLLELIAENFGTDTPLNLAVIHARVAEEGRQLLKRAQAMFNVRETLFGDLVSSLAVHGGAGVIGLFAYPVEDLPG